jgi:Glyoxalase/Bleomycin resistance protein/Dioxygenase superfamily
MAWTLRSPFHLGIATTDMEATMATLGTALGLTWVPLDRPDITHYTPGGSVRPSPRVSYSREGPLHVEILEAAPGTVYDPRARTHLHHVGYWTEDFAGDLSSAGREGWSVEAAMMDDAGRLATFAYLTRPGEVRVELIDAAQRPALEALFDSAVPAGCSGTAGRTGSPKAEGDG